MTQPNLPVDDNTQRVEQIRDLLFGEAVRQLQAAIQQLDDRTQHIDQGGQAGIAHLRQQLDDLQTTEAQHIAELNQRLDAAATQLQDDVNARLQYLERQMRSANDKTAQQAVADNQALATTFQQRIDTNTQQAEADNQALAQQLQANIDALRDSVNHDINAFQTSFNQELDKLRKQTNGVLQELLKKFNQHQHILNRLDSEKVNRTDLANSFGKLVSRLSNDLSDMRDIGID